MAKLREIILCTEQDRVLGDLLLSAVKAKGALWRALRDVRQFAGCVPDCDQWLLDKWDTGMTYEPSSEDVIQLARDFVRVFGDTECDPGYERPGY